MHNKNNIDLPDGYEYEGPFIKQVTHSCFEYTTDYKARQSTNDLMSYLRLGWLSSHIDYEEMHKLSLVDIGCGNGVFLECVRGKFKTVCGYDVCGDSISRDQLYSDDWGIIILSDVLEHFDDINDLMKMSWKYAMISFPETPHVESFEELEQWRHFKPNEHLYYLDEKGMADWLRNTYPEVCVVGSGHYEDLIRTRWDDSIPNITTMLLRR